MGKESTCNVRDTGDKGLIPGLGRSPGGGHGNPLQYSVLKNSNDRGAWWATVRWVTTSQTQLKQLSMCASIHTYIYIYAYKIFSYTYMQSSVNKSTKIITPI